MVINSSNGWVAFEGLRTPAEVTTIVTEPKLSASPQKKSQGHAVNNDCSTPSSSPISRHASRPSNEGLPPSSRFALTDRSAKRNSFHDSDQILSRQESSLSRRSIMSEEREQTKPDVVQNRAVSCAATSTIDGTSSRPRAASERGRGQSPSPARSAPERGRSRGRSEELRPTDPSLHYRNRSSSRARSTTSVRTSVSVPMKHGRERSSSRSRLPPTSANSRQRASLRSQSLTRVTSPTEASFASRNNSNVMRGWNGSKPPLASSLRRDPSPITIGDLKIGRDINFHRPESAFDTSQTSQKSRIMEKLFGPQMKNTNITDMDSLIRPRTLLAATVYHNTATNLWITTINTNQRGVAKDPVLANKYLKAFSFQTEQEARESAIANAPPKMVPFSESSSCFICDGKFAVFRRASHCRNCGVCVCSHCSTNWSSKLVPDTYNLKNKTSVKICKTCDILSSKFKQALLSGNHEDTIAIYGSGNINLRTPFPDSSKKGELMYPIHCAVQGGNLDVVRWLVEEHFCPIKLVRTGLGRKSRRGEDALILTSKGRSVLSIALERLKVDVLRYVVVDCGVSLQGSTDLKIVLRALEATLTSLPPPGGQNHPILCNEFPFSKWDKASFDEMSEPSSLGTADYAENDSIAMKSLRTRESRSDAVSIRLEKRNVR